MILFLNYLFDDAKLSKFAYQKKAVT